MQRGPCSDGDAAFLMMLKAPGTTALLEPFTALWEFRGPSAWTWCAERNAQKKRGWYGGQEGKQGVLGHEGRHSVVNRMFVFACAQGFSYQASSEFALADKPREPVFCRTWSRRWDTHNLLGGTCSELQPDLLPSVAAGLQAFSAPVCGSSAHFHLHHRRVT